MLDRDLEAPDITHTLRAGYPYHERSFNDFQYGDVQEVSEEQFIEIVKNRYSKEVKS